VPGPLAASARWVADPPVGSGTSSGTGRGYSVPLNWFPRLNFLPALPNPWQRVF